MQTGVECGMYPHHSVTFADTPQPNTEFIACERGQNIFVKHMSLNCFFIYVVCKEKHKSFRSGGHFGTEYSISCKDVSRWNENTSHIICRFLLRKKQYWNGFVSARRMQSFPFFSSVSFHVTSSPIRGPATSRSRIPAPVPS